MMSENTLLFMAKADEQVYLGTEILEPESIYIADLNYSNELDDNDYGERDDIGPYVELCFTTDMGPIVLNEDRHNRFDEGDVATMRVYITADTKRAMVVKEDDLLSKKDFAANVSEVTTATISEMQIWLDNSCFKMCLLKDARNVMPSRYVAKWKKINDKDGKIIRVIRMRQCFRGFMDTEAFSLDTFSGTAKRASQRILAS